MELPKAILDKAADGGYDFSRKLEYGESRLLDPLFFQALGKSCGWDKEYKVEGYRVPQISKCCGVKAEMDSNHLKCTLCEKFSWATDFEEPHIYYALKFYKINLTEGWGSAVKYLSDITSLSKEDIE